MSDSKLMSAARDARAFARAEFSKFKVGAALETADGSIVTGCNIETAAHGLTMCAERVAMFKAPSDGHHAFRRIAIAANAKAPVPPPATIVAERGGYAKVSETTKHTKITKEFRQKIFVPFVVVLVSDA